MIPLGLNQNSFISLSNILDGNLGDVEMKDNEQINIEIGDSLSTEIKSAIIEKRNNRIILLTCNEEGIKNIFTLLDENLSFDNFVLQKDKDELYLMNRISGECFFLEEQHTLSDAGGSPDGQDPIFLMFKNMFCICKDGHFDSISKVEVQESKHEILKQKTFEYTTAIYYYQTPNYGCDACSKTMIIANGVFHNKEEKIDVCVDCVEGFLISKKATILNSKSVKAELQIDIPIGEDPFFNNCPTPRPVRPIENLVKPEYLAAVYRAIVTNIENTSDRNWVYFKKYMLDVLYNDPKDKKGEPICGFPYTGVRELYYVPGGRGSVKPDVDFLLTTTISPTNRKICYKIAKEVIAKFVKQKEDVFCKTIGTVAPPQYDSDCRGGFSSNAEISQGSYQILFTKDAFKNFIKGLY